jgi:hypothetical protein
MTMAKKRTAADAVRERTEKKQPEPKKPKETGGTPGQA